MVMGTTDREDSEAQDRANHERWLRGKTQISALDKPTEQETRIISMLRRAVEHEQERLAWSLEDMGEKLGIPAAGVRVLMAQSWSLETAVRASAALGIELSIVVWPRRLTHGA